MLHETGGNSAEGEGSQWIKPMYVEGPNKEMKQ